jgi:hypothetical protein
MYMAIQGGVIAEQYIIPVYRFYIYSVKNIQGVPGGMCQTSGERSLG